MNEVEEFLSAHPDMGPVFREFATQYSSLAEVWENSSHSGWMLWILYKQKYRNAENLERYIEWLREQIQQNINESMVTLRLKEFDQFKGWTVEQLEEDLKAKRITEADVRYRRFISAWYMALHGSGFVLDERVTDAEWERLGVKLEQALAGEELQVPEVDADQIRLTGLKEQADKLREFLENPFAPQRMEDFYYGRGQIG